MIITIDGPTASGKSTIGRKLAERLNYFFLYSGLLYRALGYLLVTNEQYVQDQIRNPKIKDIADYLNPDRFEYHYDERTKERVIFENQDITPFLKTSYIDTVSSIISTNVNVRMAINQLQCKIVRCKNAIIDGRDAGSVVFSGADIKFYLTAEMHVRAERWRKQQARHGLNFIQQEAEEIIASRDKRDSERKTDPLVITKDALFINNSELTQDQTLDRMVELIHIKRS